MNTITPLPKYNPEFGSKNFPRYIYHMTSKANYESMLRDGFIRTGENKLHVDKGIYAFDLMNFFKCWGKPHKDWGYDDLQRIILRHIVKWFNSTMPQKSELVILKIPTSKLDQDKLFVRSMNKLFKFEESEQKFHDIPYSLQEHLAGKTPACEAPLYKMRKEAIEFIYKEDIPLQDAEPIGSIVNVPSLRKDAGFGINPVNYIMRTLLAGTPEARYAEMLKR